MDSLTKQINTAAPPQDDSWMEDNTGVAGAGGKEAGDKKKKKKNKDKKN